MYEKYNLQNIIHNQQSIIKFKPISINHSGNKQH